MLKKIGHFFLKKEVLIFLPVIVILIDLAIHQYVPDTEARYDSSIYYLLLIVFGGVYLLLIMAPGIRNFMKRHIIYYLPMITIICVFMGAWDLLTLKSKILPLPYFPGPEKNVFHHLQRLGDIGEIGVIFVKTRGVRVFNRRRRRGYNRDPDRLESKMELLDRPGHQNSRPNSSHGLDSPGNGDFSREFLRRRFFGSFCSLVSGYSNDQFWCGQRE